MARNAKKRNRLTDWQVAEKFLNSHEWAKLEIELPNGKKVNVSAQSIRSGFEALVRRSTMEYSATFRASLREVSELAQLNKETAYRVILALKQHDYILEAERDSTSSANRYSFSEKSLSPTTKEAVNTTGRNSGISDMWERRGLGKSGRLIYQFLTVPNTASNTITVLHLSKTTVYKKLKQLQKYSLIEETGKRMWVAIPFDRQREIEIASTLGILGDTQLRHEKYRAERSRDISRLLMKLIRKEESIKNELPNKPYYFICSECWQKEFPKATEPCHALTLTGSPCGFKAYEGKYFCTRHLNMGYGLFRKLFEKNDIKIGVAHVE